jgi:hypothetical protein
LGYINLGSVINQQNEFEKECNGTGESYTPDVAKYICCFMVRGIFLKLNFPYAHFATKSISFNNLFLLIWEGVKCLELMEVKVMFLTGDGASSKRKIIQYASEI